MRRFLAVLPLFVLACTGEATAPSSPERDAERETPAGPATDAPAVTADEGAAPPKPSSQGGGTQAPDVDPAGLPKVCGGAQGDGTGIQTIEWHVYEARKYRMPLGTGVREAAFDGGFEPQTLVSPMSSVDVVGQPALDVGMLSSAGTGVTTKSGFARDALPVTAPGTLGFSKWSGLVFDITAGGIGDPAGTVYVPSTSIWSASRYWSLSRPSLAPSGSHEAMYVSSLRATVGLSWVFAVAFDHACKAEKLEPMSKQSRWEPATGTSIEELQTFLVANKAHFKLGVVQTGPQHPAVLAALHDSACSPSDLAACKTLFEALGSARDEMYATPPTAADYETLVTQGNVGSWIIGQLEAKSTSSLK